MIIRPRIETKSFSAIALLLVGFAAGYIANQLLILAAFAVGDLLEWWFG